MKPQSHGAVVAFSLFLLAPTAAAQIDATWTGAAGNGLYDNVLNWDIGVVPINAGLTTYNVFLDTTGDVFFDVDGPGEITDLTLGGGQTFRINSGHSLTVLDDAVINGRIIVDNSTFSAAAPGASFGFSNNTRLTASGAGLIAIAGTSYSSSALTSTATLLSADGLGTSIDLSALQTFSTAFNYGTGVQVHTVIATNDALIDMSALQTIIAPYQAGDRLDLVMNSGGFIDLAALQTIESVSGTTRFVVDTLAYSLPAAHSFQRTEFSMIDGSTLDLPALQSQTGGSYAIPDNGTVNAGSLLWLNGVSMDIGQGGAFNAVSLTSFTNSSLDLGVNQVFNTPPLVDIDNSRFSIHDGITFSVASTEYASNGLNSNAVLFSAGGAGTTLDLSTIHSINDAFNYGTGTQVHTIRATVNGLIDLSSLGSVTGPYQSGDRLDFVIHSNGDIDLSGLQSIQCANGQVRFDLTMDNYGLPMLTLAEDTWFDLAPGLTLDLLTLETFTGRMDIRTGCTVNMPSLTAIDSATLVVEPAATLTAPLAASFTNSSLTVGAGQVLGMPTLQVIDNSRFDVSGGVAFTVAAPDYYSTGLTSSATVLAAHGNGTMVDWSSVQTINAGFNYGTGVQVHTVRATEHALIDLSNCQSITAPYQLGDRFDVRVESGATIDLSSLVTLFNNGDVRFSASGGGSMLDLSALGVFNDPSALTLQSASTARLASLGVVGSGTFSATGDVFGYPVAIVNGSVQNHLTTEANFRAGDLKLTMTNDYATFETASEDLGAIEPTPDTFEYGELTFEPPVSRGDSYIVFVDNFDNGNRPDPETPEAVYITGHDNFDGIQALNGGTLLLNGLNVYVLDAVAWINLQDLVPPVGAVAYKDGFIANRVEEKVGDTNGDCAVDVLDLLALLAAWGSTHPVYDLNGDGLVDVLDLLALLANWGDVCS